MNSLLITRRDFLYLSVLGTCFGLSGCQINSNRPTLGAYEGVLPAEMIKTLPDSWRFQVLQQQNKDITYQLETLRSLSLLAIGDGWLQDIAIDEFMPISHERYAFNDHLNIFLRGFDEKIALKLFPIGFSPWVMLFRGGEPWINKARKSWEVLLEPGLKDQLILPNSPRIIMEIASRIRDGGIDILRKLRIQAKTFDDRNALNWVVSGKAKLAIVPLQNCMSTLYKDPRLTIAIPLEGAPLNWTILLKKNNFQEQFPSSWLKEAYQMPLLSKIMNTGWIPPLSYSELFERYDTVQKANNQSLFFPEKAYNNSWSLTPLNELNRKTLEERWLMSTP